MIDVARPSELRCFAESYAVLGFWYAQELVILQMKLIRYAEPKVLPFGFSKKTEQFERSALESARARLESNTKSSKSLQAAVEWFRNCDEEPDRPFADQVIRARHVSLVRFWLPT
jgi:hypothetical protein